MFLPRIIILKLNIYNYNYIIFKDKEDQLVPTSLDKLIHHGRPRLHSPTTEAEAEAGAMALLPTCIQEALVALVGAAD
jgi:hypothetical protein